MTNEKNREDSLNQKPRAPQMFSRWGWVVFVLAIAVLAGGYFVWQKKGSATQSSPPPSPSPEVFQELSRFSNVFSGKILTIAPDGKSFQMAVTNFSGANLPPEFQKKEVRVNESTTFTLRAKKDPALYAEEWAVYNKKKDNSLPAPVSYGEGRITLEDLRENDEVEVGIVHRDGATIRDMTFTAASLIVSR